MRPRAMPDAVRGLAAGRRAVSTGGADGVDVRDLAQRPLGFARVAALLERLQDGSTGGGELSAAGIGDAGREPGVVGREPACRPMHQPAEAAADVPPPARLMPAGAKTACAVRSAVPADASRTAVAASRAAGAVAAGLTVASLTRGVWGLVS